ncbi:MAG: 2-hydroxyacyl-CoA dehydratase family protein [Candidatus Methanofastidiosia archaeon]|jgi:benzoyl-CoA reductase/2-hydroxyglutaryl-CoA dehydratase subunit BcrC/BadD/HgdB
MEPVSTIDLPRYLAAKKKETHIFAHFCSYTPEEIIHAAKILPVRIFGLSPVEKAHTHLQSYCCAYAKQVLEEGLTNSYTGSVFVHSCDTMQRLSDIWKETITEDFHESVIFPVAMDKGLNYLIKELQRFKTHVEEFAGEISDNSLKNSIKIYNENRKLLKKLYEKRKEGHIPAVVVDHIMKASMVMEKEEHSQLLKKFLEDITSCKNSNPRLLIAGSVVLTPDVLTIIEEYGSIRYDDLCIGSRYLKLVEEPSLQGIARRYSNMWCPCRYVPEDRVNYILEKCFEYAIDGVILLLQKFCEPHFFEAVHTKKILKENGYPCMVIELQDQPLEQVRTRVQAFCELLEG